MAVNLTEFNWYRRAPPADIEFAGFERIEADQHAAAATLGRGLDVRMVERRTDIEGRERRRLAAVTVAAAMQPAINFRSVPAAQRRLARQSRKHECDERTDEKLARSPRPPMNLP